jgi:type IV pilus assembly protein PilQ
MKDARRQRMLPVVFFCSLGWVYAGEALGQTGAAPADGGAPVDAAVASSVFNGISDDSSALPEGQAVGITDDGTIDLHVKDLEISKVLQLLSIQSQRNIVASKNVVGNISADLYGVDFYQALDAVLHANGFGYVEKGNFIHVYTQQEFNEINQADRKVVMQVLRLDYINAADASAFVSPMLSGSGSISVSGEAPQSLLPSSSDAGSNSFAHADTLVIRDFEENVSAILDIIKQLDVRPKQVLVEATILQARLNEANAFGVDFAIFTDLQLENFSTPLGAVNELITGASQGRGGNSGTAVSSTVGNTLTGDSSIKLGFIGSDAAVFVRALQSVTDATVLSNPKITVLNRQRADLHIGEKLGYLSTTTTETSATQTVEFLEVGTRLTVRPFVASDNFVRLELAPSISDGNTNRVVNGQVIPETSDSALTTNVIVKSAQTVVLGGLFKEDITRSRRQTPFLGDVPVLGEAFKGRDDAVQRVEVIFLVKPTVIKDESLARIGHDLEQDVTAQAMASREGLLPWSRTRLTQSHLREARQALEAGDDKKALWSTNAALSLDPTMVEAIRMREKITGQRVYNAPGSTLRQAVDRYIDESIPVEGAAAPVENHDVLSTEQPAADTAKPIAAAVEVPAEPAFADTTKAIEIAEAYTDEAQQAATEPVMKQRDWRDIMEFEGLPFDLTPDATAAEVPTNFDDK